MVVCSGETGQPWTKHRFEGLQRLFDQGLVPANRVYALQGEATNLTGGGSERDPACDNHSPQNRSWLPAGLSNRSKATVASVAINDYAA